jgi:uncharacterized surface protein with fasciclin (FAS1) repeats
MKKIKKFNPALLLSACLTVGIVGCSDDDDDNPVDEVSIAELASNNSDLSILYAAVSEYPDIATLLSEPGDYTVFAPTNAAFEAAGVESVTDLQTAFGDDAPNVLTYHVLGLKADAATAYGIAKGDVAGRSIETAYKTNNVSISTIDSAADAMEPLYINLSQVTEPNNFASNGVVHVVDSVLIPPAFLTDNTNEAQTIADIVTGNPDFSILLNALVQEGLATTAATADLTVFAPTNAAFAKVGTEAEILNLPNLSDILQYHILSVAVADSTTAASYNGRTIKTNNDADLRIGIKDGKLMVGESSTVTTANLKASNGIIHVIDTVITAP